MSYYDKLRPSTWMLQRCKYLVPRNRPHICRRWKFVKTCALHQEFSALPVCTNIAISHESSSCRLKTNRARITLSNLPWRCLMSKDQSVMFSTGCHTRMTTEEIIPGTNKNQNSHYLHPFDDTNFWSWIKNVSKLTKTPTNTACIFKRTSTTWLYRNVSH